MFSHTRLGARLCIGWCRQAGTCCCCSVSLTCKILTPCVYSNILYNTAKVLNMGKSKAAYEKSSRVLRRLEPYNKSPSVRSERQPSEVRNSERSHSRSAETSGRERHHGRSEGNEEHRSSGSRSRSRSKSSSDSRHRSSDETPAWAEEILGNQRKNAMDLQRLQSEFNAAKTINTVAAPKVAEPELDFKAIKSNTKLTKVS